MTRIWRRARALLVVSVAVAIVTGCVVQGHPTAQYPDPAALELGSYGVRPLEAPSGTTEYGRVVESVRMAETLIDPVEVDSGLRYSANTYGVMPLPTPGKARMMLADPVRAVLEREGMVAGCAVGGTDRELGAKRPEVGAARVLTAIVLRFPDSEAAGRAARDIDAVDAAVSTANQALAIPEYPQAHAHWRPGVASMAATVASGDYVVTLLIGDLTPDAGAMTAMARKAFDAQVNRLREFVPTARERLAELSLDPEGMIRRMVPPAPGRWLYPAVVSSTGAQNAGWDARILSVGVVYGSRGARLWMRGGVTESVELVAVNVQNVLNRYSTAAAARQVYSGATRKDAEAKGVVAVPVPGDSPDIRCQEDSNVGVETPRFVCRIVYGRYYAVIVSRDRATVVEKAAAQYGLLINAG
ncbi:hypothetical protein H0264_20620 [Nocardia huaxiensis]|uniref:Uncharacterized protein n=1 Tax=Nocardia huaxiensis TaxID=2755382 RepID=A0A7D6V5D9_9NOCA|nr:hypothetical protein [Nocardia huaxiensis]QLY27852.1 hypothetical protein H0264_20620 [Nocardia huaxiensis]